MLGDDVLDEDKEILDEEGDDEPDDLGEGDDEDDEEEEGEDDVM